MSRRRRAVVVGLVLVAVVVGGNLLAYAHNEQAGQSAAHRFSLAP